MAALQFERHDKAEQLLLEIDGVQLDKIADEQGLTILHHAVLNGASNKVAFLLDWARNRHSVRMNDSAIADWVNMKTLEEEWTALHYASFTGNLVATYELIRAGADINSLNANQLNMLHVAAQGDSAPSIYLFTRLQLNINARDMRQCTPLHWACYSHSESALAYLLAQKPNINARDQEGLTPLHLAVRSVEVLDSCRPVRSLLIHGANKNILDNNGLRPADYIQHVTKSDLRKQLEHLLYPQRSCRLFGGPTRFEKIKRPWCNMLIVYIIFLLVIALKIFFIYTLQNMIVSYVTLALDILALILHMCLACSDPGYLRNDRIDFMKLLEAFEPQSLCPECEVIRSGRSRHCIIC